MTYTYESGVQVHLGQQQKDIPGGATFIGTEGSIHVTRKKIVSEPKEIVTEPQFGPQDVHLDPSGNHHKNFLDCMKSRELPICDVEIGHRSATVCHLGNIAVRLGRKIQLGSLRRADRRRRRGREVGRPAETGAVYDLIPDGCRRSRDPQPGRHTDGHNAWGGDHDVRACRCDRDGLCGAGRG